MGDGGSTRSNSTSEKPEWLQQYNLVGKIGEGTYGLVFLARTKTPPKRPIAIKKFKQSKDRDGVSPTAIREEEIRRQRKELVPKAQPMPYFDRPFIPSFTYHITRWMLQFFFLE